MGYGVGYTSRIGYAQALVSGSGGKGGGSLGFSYVLVKLNIYFQHNPYF